MAHHSNTPFDKDERDAFREMFDALEPYPPFGPTGRFPQGRYTKHDEGEIAFGVAADKKAGKVVIDFGQPTAWIGMDADQADALAESLRSKAAEIRAATTHQT